MGGASAPNAEMDMPKAHVSIPTIDVADIISTTIEFTALGTSLSNKDEMTIKYKGVTQHNDATYGTDRSQA